MTKFKDVAHLYLGCECILDGEKVKLSAYHIEFWNDGIKPLLRPLDSMTEEEWLANRDKFSFDVISAYSSRNETFCDKPKIVLIFENRLNTNTLRFKDGLELIKMGFDLFSLIPNNEAIDKTKTQNNG